MVNQLTSPTTQRLYDQDFYLWLTTTAQLLQNQQFEQLDLDHLIEEIESMGRSEKRELRSRLRRIIEHLLKLQYWAVEKENNQRGWRNTVIEQRSQLQDLLKDSPSLKPFLSEIFGECYAEERVNTALKTDLPLGELPVVPPFTLENALDVTYFPD